MSKKKNVKPEIKKVLVKIKKEGEIYSLSSAGKQVEMTDKDENYIKKIFTEFDRAQNRLKKYYEQE